VGELSFSLTESYYTDSTNNPIQKRSGYELDFQAYTAVQAQNSSDYNGDSQVQLEFALTRSSVVYDIEVTPLLSPVQQFSSVLSAVVSLMGVFATIAGLLKENVIPRISKKHGVGRVKDYTKEGGEIVIESDNMEGKGDRDDKFATSKEVEESSTAAGNFASSSSMQPEAHVFAEDNGVEGTDSLPGAVPASPSFVSSAPHVLRVHTSTSESPRGQRSAAVAPAGSDTQPQNTKLEPTQQLS
jgi:hypothetical protein